MLILYHTNEENEKDGIFLYWYWRIYTYITHLKKEYNIFCVYTYVYKNKKMMFVKKFTLSDGKGKKKKKMRRFFKRVYLSKYRKKTFKDRKNAMCVVMQSICERFFFRYLSNIL